MKTRTRRQTPFLQSKLAFLIALGIVIAISLYGGIVYGLDAAYKLDHFAPAVAHPSDYYSEACLTVALLAGITLFLARIPSTPPRYRRTSTGRGWFDARPDLRDRRFAPGKGRRKSNVA